MATTMKDFRRLAAAMDQRVRQLAAERLTDLELMNRMAGHLPDLQLIWVGATDDELVALCKEFPGFYQFASLMETAAEAERASGSGTYQELPELPNDLKRLLSALLSNAATLERELHGLLDGHAHRHVDRLSHLRQTWLADRDRLLATMVGSGMPDKVTQLVAKLLEQMADRIAALEQRVLAS